MGEFLTTYEGQVRLAAFVSVLIFMILLEQVFPKRERAIPITRRWSTNLSIVIIDAAVVRVLFPVLAVDLAIVLTDIRFGLFHWLEVPFWPAFFLSVVLLDLIIYTQHIAFHHVPILWRMHKVHHADIDVDVSTGVRFHPTEIVVSMLIKLGAVAFLGTPVAAVVIFEIVLNATSMFNHSNCSLSPRLDRVVRLFLVTPDMHRVHHSILRRETDSNFGFNLPIWDRIFGTYRAQPEAGHHEMELGLPDCRCAKTQGLLWSLAYPFHRNARKES